MQKSTLYGLGIFVMILVGGFLFLGSDSSTVTGNVVSINGEAIQGQTQKVILSQKGYNYQDATAEAGKPISLSADSSVVGCLRSPTFNIDGKKYSKYLQSDQDTLELPALSKGTHSFTCSMGMGLGKILVK